jgi:hypothetical protein
MIENIGASMVTLITELYADSISGSQIEFSNTFLAYQYSNDISAHSTKYVENNELWYNKEIAIRYAHKG